MREPASSKKRRQSAQDDGHTVANMNVEGFRWYRSEQELQKQEELRELKLSRREQRKLMGSAIRRMLLPVLCTLVGMSAAFLLVWIWFH